MKTLIAVLALSILSLASVAPAMATPGSDKKITICHATHSEKNPFVEITISKSALKAHFSDKHQEGEDTFGPCPIAVVTPTPKPTVKPSPTETAVVTTPTKGATPTTEVPIPPHSEPGVTEPAEVVAYPAPSVTPNTMNGTPLASNQPTPAVPVQESPDRLANTGASDWLWLWALVGGLALTTGIGSVIHVRRKA